MGQNGLAEGWALHRFEALGSTMDAARDLAESGAPDRSVVRAEYQTSGRGRHGRVWTSDPGNLYMTAILRETRPMADCAQLSFVAALALATAIPHPGLSLKWPNDVLIDGAKTAGILLEAGGQNNAPWILLGIGVNIVNAPTETPYPATSLTAAGLALDADGLCRALSEALDHWRGIWHREGAGRLHRAWLDKAHGLKGPIRVRLSDREIAGTFEGLDSDGRLQLLDADGSRHHISAGDVFFA